MKEKNTRLRALDIQTYLITFLSFTIILTCFNLTSYYASSQSWVDYVTISFLSLDFIILSILVCIYKFQIKHKILFYIISPILSILIAIGANSLAKLVPSTIWLYVLLGVISGYSIIWAYFKTISLIKNKSKGLKYDDPHLTIIAPATISIVSLGLLLANIYFPTKVENKVPQVDNDTDKVNEICDIIKREIKSELNNDTPEISKELKSLEYFNYNQANHSFEIISTYTISDDSKNTSYYRLFNYSYSDSKYSNVKNLDDVFLQILKDHSLPAKFTSLKYNQVDNDTLKLTETYPNDLITSLGFTYSKTLRMINLVLPGKAEVKENSISYFVSKILKDNFETYCMYKIDNKDMLSFKDFTYVENLSIKVLDSFFK